MLEVTCNLWEVPDADAVVITTNGTVKKNGCCVMGRGCAAEAKAKFPLIDQSIGSIIKSSGNHVIAFYRITPDIQFQLVTFPVKHNWWEPADPELIKRSAIELKQQADDNGWKVVAMPRPGCGNGRLNWTDVKPLLSNLDDRFFVCDYGGV